MGFKLCFSLLMFIILFSSCGAKKKTILHSSNGNSYAPHRTNKSNINSYYANLLDVSPKELNADLYLYIDPWLFVPHRLGGMDMSGIDCSGFVTLVYENVYRKSLARRSIDMASDIKRKYEEQLKEGDLVFFSFGGKDIDHVGIYLFNGKFIHVSTSKGVMISNLKEPWYYKYFVRCGTPK